MGHAGHLPFLFVLSCRDIPSAATAHGHDSYAATRGMQSAYAPQQALLHQALRSRTYHNTTNKQADQTHSIAVFFDGDTAFDGGGLNPADHPHDDANRQQGFGASIPDFDVVP